MSRSVLLAAAAIALLGAPAAVAAPQPDAATQPAPAATAALDKRVCKSIVPTGTRLQKGKVCKKAREWIQQSETDQQNLNRMQKLPLKAPE